MIAMAAMAAMAMAEERDMWGMRTQSRTVGSEIGCSNFIIRRYPFLKLGFKVVLRSRPGFVLKKRNASGHSVLKSKSNVTKIRFCRYYSFLGFLSFPFLNALHSMSESSPSPPRRRTPFPPPRPPPAAFQVLPHLIRSITVLRATAPESKPQRCGVRQRKKGQPLGPPKKAGC